jgi:hypothetical protein
MSDEIHELREDLRAFRKEVLSRFEKLEARPRLPPWIQTVLIAALCTFVGVFATQAAQGLHWNNNNADLHQRQER